ncbi:MAG: hypothetical protein JO125_16000 [Chloroflexi bacterium]|nr:hypothetical protein [Chloroflexota bacterium]
MADAYEQKVLFFLRKMLLEDDPQIGSGGRRITIEEVRLEPGKPTGNWAVILFRQARSPHCLFGFRMPAREGFIQGVSQEQLRVWNDPEGSGPQVDADMIIGYLREEIVGNPKGLPPDCPAETIVWI